VVEGKDFLCLRSVDLLLEKFLLPDCPVRRLYVGRPWS
jgi:hypothetical protein